MRAARVVARLFVATLALAGSAAFGQAVTPADGAGGTTIAAPPTAPQRSSVPASAPAPLIAHGYFGVNAAYQTTANAFTSSWSLPYYQENASLSAGYSFGSGMVLDIGGGARVVRNLVVGAAFSRYRRSQSAALSGTVPHPLYYDQARSVQADVPGPSRTETALHVSAMWLFAPSARIQVGVFGGPTVFSVDQVSISGVNFSEVYPYDTVSVAGTTTSSQHASKVTFNVGTDVTFLLARQVGVGILVRYSAATVNTPEPDGGAVTTHAGGLQVGGGLRVRF